MIDYMHNLDPYDRKLLEQLQRNSAASRAELSERVALSESQVARRKAALEAAGVIRGYRAIIDPFAAGLGVTAFVQVKLQGHSKANAKRFAALVQRAPGICEAHAVAGGFDYLLKIKVADLAALQRLLADTLLANPAVDRVHSEIVLDTIVEDRPLSFTAS